MALQYKDQPFHSVTLESVEKPTVDQIRLLCEFSLIRFDNMLEIRRVLRKGGFQCFGELLIDDANDLSARLTAARIPHRTERTKTWRLA